jgi:hypothetical protein
MGHIGFARFVGMAVPVWRRLSTLSPPLFAICVQIDGPYIHIPTCRDQLKQGSLTLASFNKKKNSLLQRHGVFYLKESTIPVLDRIQLGL